MRHLFVSLLLAPLVFSSAACSCQTVEPGNIGIVVVWGKVSNQSPYPEGMHITNLATALHEMNIRLQALEVDDVPCRSQDNVAIQADVTLQYSLARATAPKVYRQLGDHYADTVFLPAVRSAVRDAVARVDALVAAQSRESLESLIEQGVRNSVRLTLQRQNLPQSALVIDGLQLKNMDLPQTLTESIESIQRQRNSALERAQAIETAQQEADRLRIEAEGANRVAILEAQRNAEVRRIAGESEAAYNRVVSASLTPNLVELRRIEAQRAITTNPNAQLILVGGSGNGSVPVVLNTQTR